MFGSLLLSLRVIIGHLARPQEQVVSEQLHYKGGIFVVLVLNGVQVCYGFVKGSTGHFTRLRRILHDLIVEHTVVQSEAQLEWMSR